VLGALLFSAVADEATTPKPPPPALGDPAVSLLTSDDKYKASGILITNKEVLFASAVDPKDLGVAKIRLTENATHALDNTKITSVQLGVGIESIFYLAIVTLTAPLEKTINTQLLLNGAPTKIQEKRMADNDTAKQPVVFTEIEKTVTDCYTAYIGKSKTPLNPEAFVSVICTNLVGLQDPVKNQPGAPFLYEKFVAGLDSGTDPRKIVKADYEKKETFPEAFVISVPKYLAWIAEKVPGVKYGTPTNTPTDQSTTPAGAAQQLANALMVFICAIFAKIML